MIMTESVDSLVTVSSQDLWTEICSSLPHPDQNEESNNAFADSFADSYVHVMENQMEVTGPSLQMNEKPWVPLKDSELYLASLGTRSYFRGCHPLTILTCVRCLLPCFCCQRPSGTTTSAADKAFLKASAANNRTLDQSGALLSTIDAFRKALPDLLATEEMGLQERRLMRIKGLSQEVTSKDILHTLSQAKKESWDRFLQEKSESEFYMEGTDSDESTLEYLKRWLQPEKVAVSSEEIQFLIPLGAPPEKQEAEEEEEPTPVEQ